MTGLKPRGASGHRGFPYWYAGLIIQCVAAVRACVACFGPPAPHSMAFSLDSEPVT